jgi:hypothetical protein
MNREAQAATVYRQKWTRIINGHTFDLDVLALDTAMAIEMGKIVLLSYRCLLPEWSLTICQAVPDASTDRRLSILGHEPAECAELRERVYAERQGRG